MATATWTRPGAGVSFDSTKRFASSSKPSAGDKKETWTSMLENASRGKKLPEKNLLVLGGTPESQAEFVSGLTTGKILTDNRPPRTERSLANRFAIGYTYQDVLDADQDDVLARLSIHLLPESAAPLTGMLKSTINSPTVIQELLVVILLDWTQPWLWLRQLRDWIRALITLLQSLDRECQIAMEENMKVWQRKGRSNAIEQSIGTKTAGLIDSLALGPGEWDEPIGVPISVVCQNTNKVTVLEKEYGWGDDDHDFVLQVLRIVLLKHGGSLAYTMPDAPGQLQTLIHTSLGIHSLLQRRELKPIHFEQDRILIPTNWDSWGKIRVLREEFLDMEGLSKAWSVDVHEPLNIENDAQINQSHAGALDDNDVKGTPDSVITIFETKIKGPSRDGDRDGGNDEDRSSVSRYPSDPGMGKLEVECMEDQKFLEQQTEVLEKLKAEDDQARPPKGNSKQGALSSLATNGNSSLIEDQIGPVQFNVGGIQMDAEDMVQRLKEREAKRTPDSTVPHISPKSNSENQALASYFAGLVNRTGGGATDTGTPTKQP